MAFFILEDIDIVRGVLAQGMAENMTLADLYACAEYADDVEDWMEAVNILAQTVPQETEGTQDE